MWDDNSFTLPEEDEDPFAGTYPCPHCSGTGRRTIHTPETAPLLYELTEEEKAAEEASWRSLLDTATIAE